MEQHEVVVVGGGPVGLALALGLARDGVRVLVLEKEPHTAEHSRAPAIWPGTQEILAGLGVIDRFAAAAIAVPRFELWDADRERVLVRLPFDELSAETRFPRLLILPQSRTEAFLRDALQACPSAELRYCAKVTDLVQDEAGVDVLYRNGGGEQRVRGSFVAGCDGAHSRVREAIGGALRGSTYAAQAVLADVRVARSEALRFPRITTVPRFAVAIRIEGDLWRLIIPFFDDADEAAVEARVQEASRSLFPRPADERVWTSSFHLHRRVSTRWRDGRVVLAGDAAHLNSPVGGEGMNAGIFDAALLRQTLVAALASGAPDGLDDYVARRRRAVEEGVNPFTDRLTRLLLAGDGRWVRTVFRTAGAVLRLPAARRRLLRRLAMLG